MYYFCISPQFPFKRDILFTTVTISGKCTSFHLPILITFFSSTKSSFYKNAANMRRKIFLDPKLDKTNIAKAKISQRSFWDFLRNSNSKMVYFKNICNFKKKKKKQINNLFPVM